MDFAIESSQQALQASARAVLEREWTPDRLRASERADSSEWRALWSRMASLGWLGLGLAEEKGGVGGGYLDLYLLCEELGRALAPGPFVETVALARVPLLESPVSALRQEILEAVIQGEEVASIATLEADGRQNAESVRYTARRNGAGYLLDGTKLFVVHAPAASWFLCSARTRAGSARGGISLFLVGSDEPGLRTIPTPNTAGCSLHALHLEGVFVPHGAWPALERAALRAAPLICGMIAGAAAPVREITLRYARERMQFGRPIGQFQAVQSLCVDVAADAHLIRLLARQAAWAIDAGLFDIPRISMAASFAARAIRHVTRQAHEVHAGMGFMLDYDLQLFTRRCFHWSLSLGDPHRHDLAVAEAIGL